MPMHIPSHLRMFAAAGTLVVATGSIALASAQGYSFQQFPHGYEQQYQDRNAESDARIQQYLQRYLTQDQMNQYYARQNQQNVYGRYGIGAAGQSSAAPSYYPNYQQPQNQQYVSPEYQAQLYRQFYAQQNQQNFHAQTQAQFQYPYVMEQHYQNDPYYYQDSEQAYVQCMQPIVQERENALRDSYRTYHDRYEQLIDQRAQARMSFWQIPDSRERRDAERQVDRDFRDADRDLKRQFDDYLDDINDQFKTEEKYCAQMKKDIERGNRGRRSSSSRSSRYSYYSRSSRSYPLPGAYPYQMY